MAGNVTLYRAFEMKAMVFCQDKLFLPTMTGILRRLGLQMYVTSNDHDAASVLMSDKLDAVIIDWQEVDNLGEFLQCIRNSGMNKDVIQVAIARDLLDLRQAFSAGIQFLIHKPPSVVQISRCLEAVQAAILRQRRKSHREPVRVPAAVTTRGEHLQGATIVNISNDGLGLLLNHRSCRTTAELSTGAEVSFAFSLPETRTIVRGTGIIVWMNRNGSAGLHFNSGNTGLQFEYLADSDQQNLEHWVGIRFERELERLLSSSQADTA